MASFGEPNLGTYHHPDIPVPTFAGVNVWTAASDGDLPKIREMIDSGAHRADEPDPQGYTCIHAASSYGHHDMLRYLLGQLAVDVNCKDEDGDSPLHVCEDVETAQILLAAGADPSAVNSDGKTPWEVALEEERDVADFLKERCPYAAAHAEQTRVGVLEADADATLRISLDQLRELHAANPLAGPPTEPPAAPEWEELIANARQDDAKRRKAG